MGVNQVRRQDRIVELSQISRKCSVCENEGNLNRAFSKLKRLKKIIDTRENATRTRAVKFIMLMNVCLQILMFVFHQVKLASNKLVSKNERRTIPKLDVGNPEIVTQLNKLFFILF